VGANVVGRNSELGHMDWGDVDGAEWVVYFLSESEEAASKNKVKREGM
jgi:hypothetical protein